MWIKLEEKAPAHKEQVEIQTTRGEVIRAMYEDRGGVWQYFVVRANWPVAKADIKAWRPVEKPA